MKELDRNAIKTQEQADLKARQRAINRLKDMEELTEKLNKEEDDDKTDQLQEEQDTFALGFSKLTEIEVQLSTGGDADGFKIYFNGEEEAVKGVFYWADWGQYAEYGLSEEELNQVVDFFNLYDLESFK